MHRIPSVASGLPVSAWAEANAPAAPRPHRETFRVVHHKHIIPGPRVLLPGNYHGITGDVHALTRNLGPLSLAFTKTAFACSPPMTQIFIAGGAGWVWIFGVRQNIHGAMLATRALRASRQESHAIANAPGATPEVANALLSAQRAARAETQVRRAFGHLVGGVAAAGAGLGWLFRAIAIGGHVHALTQIGLPMLQVFFPVLALSNAGLAAYEGIAFGKACRAAHRAKHHTRWRTYGDHAPQLRQLLRARHSEQRWCRAGNAITHAMVAVGAPLTFFVGPIGLAVLVPGVVGNLAVDIADQRIIHYPRQLSLQQQLSLGRASQLGAAIVGAEARYELLHTLRRDRHKQYPRGLGINMVRPFASGVRAVRNKLQPKKAASRRAPETTLARMADGQYRIAHQHAHAMRKLQLLGMRTEALSGPAVPPMPPDPNVWGNGAALPALYDLLRQANVCEPFAKAVLQSRVTRSAIAALHDDRLMQLEKKRWHLDVETLLTQSGATDDAQLTERLLHHGEAALLVQGKNQAMFERRQLLDMLDTQIREYSKRPSG